MKKLFVFLAVVMLTTGLYSAISGSAHDFSGFGWAGNEICLPCHTPHGAKTGADNLVPLWNHDVTASVFTVYTSPTGTLDAGALGQPAGVSKACLSCHDGTIGVDAYGTNVPVPTMVVNPLGADLSNDHPISFTYNTALSTADGELYDPAVQASGLGGTIQNDLLFADQLECASCHDVHNTTCPACASLLVIDNAASDLCLTCHNK
ncbi:MAG: cytochrome C [Candidatus Aminicenantes bacterium]|nr:MAG: cytochrome C [Candidatus Aminicenantes bacterium]